MTESTSNYNLSGNMNNPSSFGKYKIIRKLGRGGMGIVYLAEDLLDKKLFALKVPYFEPDKYEHFKARFLKEGQLAASLKHPNICKVFGVEEIDGHLVMVMEYLRGKLIEEYIKPDKLISPRQAVAVIFKAALALKEAHNQGVIHRDIKPSNIMLVKRDPSSSIPDPVIMDFGLAKTLYDNSVQLTKSGMILGTPSHMSKEQWFGKEVELSPTTDIYSLGMILYELLTGKLPYDVEINEPSTVWFVKLVTEPQILVTEHNPGISKVLEEMVMRSIAIEVEDRYQTMQEFADDLLAYMQIKTNQNQSESSWETEAIGSPPVIKKNTKQSSPKIPAIISNPKKKTLPTSFKSFILSAVVILSTGIILSLLTNRETSIQLGIASSSFIKGSLTDFDKSNATNNSPEQISLAGLQSNIDRDKTSAEIRSNNNAKTEDNQSQQNRSSAASFITDGERAGELRECSNLGINFRWCPPATFNMGSPLGEINRDVNENQVSVNLTEGFWLQETEVTRGEWIAIMGSKPWLINDQVKKEDGLDYPAVFLIKQEIEAFCEKLTKSEREAGRIGYDQSCRLPTEAEWEYACRAGTTTAYSFGDNEKNLGNYAWVSDSSNRSREQLTKIVKQKLPNQLGLYDMHGNAWELCSDKYNSKYIGGINPHRTLGDLCIIRGGSCDSVPSRCRSAHRGKTDENMRNSYTGFRLLLGRLSGHDKLASVKEKANKVDAITKDMDKIDATLSANTQSTSSLGINYDTKLTKLNLPARSLNSSYHSSAGYTSTRFSPNSTQSKSKFSLSHDLRSYTLLLRNDYDKTQPFAGMNLAYCETGTLKIKSEGGSYAWNIARMGSNRIVSCKLRVAACQQNGKGNVGVCLTTPDNKDGIMFLISDDFIFKSKPSMFARNKPERYIREIELEQNAIPQPSMFHSMIICLNDSIMNVYVNDILVETYFYEKDLMNDVNVAFTIECSTATTVEMDSYTIHRPK